MVQGLQCDIQNTCVINQKPAINSFLKTLNSVAIMSEAHHVFHLGHNVVVAALLSTHVLL